jgi:hypothetical protein
MATDAETATQKRYEARLRRMAGSMGLVLRKSRARDACRLDYACFRIESRDGRALSGTYPYPYSLSLDGVEEALELLRDNPPEIVRDAQGRLIHGSAGAADSKWGSVL